MFIKSFRIKAIILISFIYFFIYPTTCFALEDTENILTVRVGYYSLENSEEKSDNQSFQGFDFDYYNLIEQYTGWNYEFIEDDFDSCLQMLKEGKLDIIGGLTKPSKLEEDIIYSEVPYTTNTYKIYTKSNNDMLYYESFRNFDGMSVGVVASNQQIPQLKEYAKKNNFALKLAIYNSLFEMESALKYGKIDAIYSSKVTEVNQYKIIASFKKTPIYFGVSKNKPKLSKQLNLALKKIKSINPRFSRSLQQKYGNKNLHLTPSFTKEEAEYIRTNPLIYIIIKENWEPFIFINSKTNSMDGIFADIFKHIHTITGLNFSFCTTKESKKLKAAHPNANFITTLNSDFNCANNYNYDISNNILTSRIMMVSNEEIVNKHNLSIALPKHICALQLVEREQLTYNYKITYLENIEECLKALKKGQVDAICLLEHTTNYYIKCSEYEHLHTQYYNSSSEMLSVGVSENCDKELLPIINKSLMCISNKQLSNFIIKNAFMEQEFSFKTIFHAYPEETILTIFGISTLIILSLMSTISNNKKKKEEIKNALLEASLINERFKVALHQLSCDIIEYDFTTNNLYYLDKLYDTKTMVPLENKNTLHSFTLCGAVYPEFKNIFNNLYERVLAGESTIEFTLKGENNKKECWGRFTLTAVYDGAKPIRMIGTMADVTAEICVDLDSLTRVYNRKAFADNVILNLSKRVPNVFGAFVMIDMDDFKGINDTYGHYAGDTCLVYIANKLKLGFNNNDLVARMGGDEFAVFTYGYSSENQVIKKVETIFDSMNNTAVTLKDGTAITLGISIGVAILPQHGTSFVSLYENADKALYKAKQATEKHICIFND